MNHYVRAQVTSIKNENKGGILSYTTPNSKEN